MNKGCLHFSTDHLPYFESTYNLLINDKRFKEVNTFIPLDMLFLDKNGFITHLVKETRPLSLDIISSMGNVLGVLELLGGTSDRLGIRRGDRVEHAAFGS